MKNAWGILLATIVTAGCLSTGGGSTPPPGPVMTAMDIVVRSDRQNAPIASAAVLCNNEPWGVTNDDGYLLRLSTPVGAEIRCEISAESHFSATDVRFVPTPTNQHLVVSLQPFPDPVPEYPTPSDPIQGMLRLLQGIYYGDSAGPVLPTYAHAGDLFSVYVRDPHRARDQLDHTARAGHHGVRTWLTLGCGPTTVQGCKPGNYWRGREVGPDVTPEYWARLREFFIELQHRKLRLVASQGDIGQLRDRRAYMQQLRQLDNEVHVVDWLDCGNEAWQTGEPDPVKLAECVGYYGSGSSLRTLTDAPLYGAGVPAPEQFDRFSIPPADAFDVHSYRGGHSWDKRRHIWGYTYCGEGCPRLKTGINSEPPGGGIRVSAIENRHEMDDESVALLAVASHLGRQAFVWFSGEGVILDKGLQDEPGFLSVPRAVALLPPDLYTYETSHHSGATFQHLRILLPQGEVRIDGRQASDGRFVYTIDGPPGTYSLDVVRGFSGELCHPGLGTCEPVTKRAGERLSVSFSRGRILKGRIQ